MDVSKLSGMRWVAASCQDVTSLIAHHLNIRSTHILNYIDDFGRVASTKEEAQSHFHHLQAFLDGLGLGEAKHKAFPLSHKMTWLGVASDVVSVSITIPSSKLHDITTLVSDWKIRTHTDLHSL